MLKMGRMLLGRFSTPTSAPPSVSEADCRNASSSAVGGRPPLQPRTSSLPSHRPRRSRQTSRPAEELTGPRPSPQPACAGDLRTTRQSEILALSPLEPAMQRAMHGSPSSPQAQPTDRAQPMCEEAARCSCDSFVSALSTVPSLIHTAQNQAVSVPASNGSRDSRSSMASSEFSSLHTSEAMRASPIRRRQRWLPPLTPPPNLPLPPLPNEPPYASEATRSRPLAARTSPTVAHNHRSSSPCPRA